MADNTERILLRVDLNYPEQKLVQIRKDIDQLKDSNKKLNKETADGALQYEKNSAKIKALNADVRVYENVLKQTIVITNTAKGSNDQLRATLSKLTAQYNALSKEERDNTKTGKDLTKQIKGISDELKKNESAIGDNRRNVGNYKDSILEAVGASGFFNTELGKMVQGLSTGLQQSLIVAKASFGSFSGALKGGVIGVIGLATAALTSFFTATGQGEDTLEQFTANVKGGFSGIAQNLANSVKVLKSGGGFGEAWDATFGEKARKNVHDTAMAYTNVTLALQRIEDQERAARVEVSKRRLEIDKLLLTSKDQNVSDEQQIANLEKAKKLEVELTQVQIGFAKVRLQNALDIQATAKDPTDAMQDAVANARVDLNELAGQSELVLQQADNRISAQQQQIKAKMLKDLQDSINENSAALTTGLDQDRADLIKKLAHNAITYFEYEKELSKITLDGLKIRKEDADKAAQDAQETDNKLSKLGIDAADETLKIDAKAYQDKVQLEKQTAEELLAIKNKAIADEVSLEQAKFNAISGISNGLIELNRAIAGNNADSTEFGKALAIVQIAVAEAESLAETIRNATAAAAAGGPSAPFLQVAYIASGVASVAAAFIQAKQLLDTAPVPKPEFYDGGYTSSGNPREVATNLGQKDYTYHKSEYVMPNKVLRTPEGSALAMAAENIRNSSPHLNLRLPGYADGGFTARTLGAGAATEANMVAAMKGVVIETSIVEIERVQKKRNLVKDRGKLS